jgi:hypothetical protein
VVFGEVGLAGEIRPAPRGQERLREAAKLGFTRALVPEANRPRQAIAGIEVIPVRRVEEAVGRLRELEERAGPGRLVRVRHHSQSESAVSGLLLDENEGLPHPATQTRIGDIQQKGPNHAVALKSCAKLKSSTRGAWSVSPG